MWTKLKILGVLIPAIGSIIGIIIDDKVAKAEKKEREKK